MNYRHAYHAGGAADVLKHAVLALTIEYAKQKPTPLRVLDTHAGLGRYDLEATQATKTGEWCEGIGRLLGPEASALPADVAAILAPYLGVVSGENPLQTLRHYPGSPLIARRLLRPQDRLIATELHPDDCAALARRFARDSQTKIVALDGWLALKAFLPPRERRGIVLIDPPYEDRDELRLLPDRLAAAIRRFEGGTYLLWYPIKDVAAVEVFQARLRTLGIAKMLSVELMLRAPHNPLLLNGSGLIVVNPPWTLPAQLEILAPFLGQRLALEEGGGHAIEWLVE